MYLWGRQAFSACLPVSFQCWVMCTMVLGRQDIIPSPSQELAAQQNLHSSCLAPSTPLLWALYHHLMPTEQISKSLKGSRCSLLPTWNDAGISFNNGLDIPLCIKLRVKGERGQGKQRQVENPSCSSLSPYILPSLWCFAPPWAVLFKGLGVFIFPLAPTDYVIFL